MAKIPVLQKWMHIYTPSLLVGSPLVIQAKTSHVQVLLR